MKATHRQSFLVALAGAVTMMLGTSELAFGDDHLPNLMPRTAEEEQRIAEALAHPTDFSAARPHEELPAGAATAETFGKVAPNLTAEAEFDAELGRALFEKLWVASPSSTLASDGLGPLYNARSCATCHEGASRAKTASTGLIARLSDGKGAAHPTLGLQLQTQAAPGRTAEGTLVIDWLLSDASLADGTQVSLQQPMPMPIPGVGGIDLRVAPQLTGLGLLEAVPEMDILAGADPFDLNDDGISGRGAMVFSPETGTQTLGRFGHKAAHATLLDQTASAFSTDLGLSSPLVDDPWGDCTIEQTECRAGPHGEDAGQRDGAEVSGESLQLVAHYSGTLSPARRKRAGDPDVLAGQAIFHDTGCANCHRPAFVTHRLPDRPWESFQLIWPYSDLLLHDLGPGLAAMAGEGDATAAEWRTAPLWGLGAALAEDRGLLHDGRARTALEAILWHGGEAEGARNRAIALTETDRAALIAFLESL